VTMTLKSVSKENLDSGVVRLK